MAATGRDAVRELLEQTMATMDAPLAASDRELPLPSSHKQDSLTALAADQAARAGGGDAAQPGRAIPR